MNNELKESITMLKNLNEEHNLKIPDKAIEYLCKELLLTSWQVKFVEYSFSKHKYPSITKF